MDATTATCNVMTGCHVGTNRHLVTGSGTREGDEG